MQGILLQVSQITISSKDDYTENHIWKFNITIIYYDKSPPTVYMYTFLNINFCVTDQHIMETQDLLYNKNISYIKTVVQYLW